MILANATYMVLANATYTFMANATYMFLANATYTWFCPMLHIYGYGQTLLIAMRAYGHQLVHLPVVKA
jgi:hypothetical protein